MSPPKAFTDLREHFEHVHHLNSALALLHWDQETYMPEGGISARAEQIAHLSSVIHEKKTSLKVKTLLTKLISFTTGKVKVKGLSLENKAILREWLKDYQRYHKLSTKFVKTFSQVTAESSQIWQTAKKNNQFKLFAPFLQKIVELNREKAEKIGYSAHPYDPLIEHFEPSMNTEKLTKLFSNLKKELKALLKKIALASPIDAKFLTKKVPFEKQLIMGKTLLAQLPMEEEYTRLDFSSHPFSMAMHPHDSRITTRVHPNLFLSNLFSILHEAGHSMYEMGLKEENFGTPLGEALSLSVHESQSRLWETLLGRSLPFWKWYYPTLKQQAPTILKGVPLQKFYRAANAVCPSFIRVESDEVSYCLHVILRFEVEKELIEGKLSVHDLPKRWNELMREFFGIEPPTDSQGCLQDIHWSLGDFGYFPTYALGNLIAAQLFQTFEKKHPDWADRVAEGELLFIREWLTENVHQWGRMYATDDLVTKVTQKPLSEKPYIRYLKTKYQKIYSLR